MSTQTDKAGEGRNLWHCPLEWLPEFLLFLPHRQSLRPAQESQSPSASLDPCHTCSTRGISAPLLQGPGPETSSSATAAHRQGERLTGEDTTQKVALTRGGDNDPSPQPRATLHARPGTAWDNVQTTRAQGLCLAGWQHCSLFTSHHISYGIKEEILTQKHLPFVYSSRNLG